MSGKVLGLVAALAACKSSNQGPHELRIDKLGVAVTVSGDWQVNRLRDDVFSLRKGHVFVNISPGSHRVTLAEARPTHVKIHQERVLPSGAFLFIYDATGGPDTKVLTVKLPLGDATINCAAPLFDQFEQHHQMLIDVCSSLVAKK